MRGQRAGGGGDALLGGERAGHGEHRNDDPEAAEPHRQAEHHVVERGVGGEAGEGAAVVVGGRGEGVEDFRETVRAGVGDAGAADVEADGDGGADEDQDRRDQDDEGAHLHLERLDLLAEVFGRAADHQAGDENGEDGEDEHAVEARADAAENDFAELHQHQRHHAAERGVGVVHAVDRAARGGGGHRREQAAVGDAEAYLLAFHVAAGRIDAERMQQRVALLFEGDHGHHGDDEDRGHRREHRPALARVADQAPEGEAQRAGDEEDGQHLAEVGERRRVFIRVRRVGVEDAAAVGAEQLDRFLRGERAHRQGLRLRRYRFGQHLSFGVLERLAVEAIVFETRGFVRRGFDRACRLERVEVLDCALVGQEKGVSDRERQQHVERDAAKIDPGVADGLRAVAGKPPDQGDDDGDAGGRGEEVLHRQDEHLGQVAHRRFAGVALPVGIGDEADGGVEGRIGRDRAEALRVERQPALQTLYGVGEHEAEGVEDHDGEGVFQPAHFFFGADAAETVERRFEAPRPGVLRVFAADDAGDVGAQGASGEEQDAEEDGKEHPGVRGHEKRSG